MFHTPLAKKKPVKAIQTHKQLVNIGTTKNKRVRRGKCGVEGSISFNQIFIYLLELRTLCSAILRQIEIGCDLSLRLRFSLLFIPSALHLD